jgi:hypothetical protein
MINVVKTILENKTTKPFLYYIGNSKIILDPAKPVTINGDIFSKETKQEGNTEGLLVNIYNGNIDYTLVVDDTFVTNVTRESVVTLPRRSQSRLIQKVENAGIKEVPAKEEPKKEEPVKAPEKAPVVVEKPAVQEESKQEEPKKVKEEKAEPAKKSSKATKEEQVTLNDITVTESKKKATKL